MDYRADIQILRGIAVLSVILFHLFPTKFQNGYLGVDIFFVISGFLMATLYSYENEKRNAKKFLIKRFKRIVPAYIATLLLFLLCSIFYLSPYDYSLVSYQAISSLFLLPNVYFWTGEDYFNSTTYKPLIHLWSLGVEMQFYLLVPVITYLISKRKIVILFLTLLSFSLCIYVAAISSKTAFFMLPTRIWEFGIGYIIAIYLPNKTFANSYIKAIALFMLIALLVSDYQFTTKPGLGALLACILTGIVIYKKDKLPAYSLMPLKLIETVGKYSYSLYLVHMPLIGLFWYEPLSSLDKDVPLDYKIFLYLLAVFATTLFIYQNFEKHSHQDIKLRKITLNSALLFLLAILLTGTKINQTYMGEYATYVSNATLDTPTWRCGKLFTLKNTLDSSDKSCQINSYFEKSVNILIVGDSHMNAIKSPLIELANKNNENIFLYDESCNPGNKGCKIKSILNEVKKYNIDKIIIHGLYYNINYEKIISLKSALSKKIMVYFIKPIPTFSKSIPKYLYENTESGAIATLHDFKFMENKYKKYQEKILTLEKSGVKTIDTIDLFCKPNCVILNNNLPFYYDSHHLTNTGASVIKKRLENVIF